MPARIFAGITFVYALIYTFYNCKTGESRKKLLWTYLLPFVFLYALDVLDCFIYIIIASIFSENRERFLRVYFVTLTLIFVFSIIGYYYNILPHDDVYRDEFLRKSLGFVHPNTTFRYFFGSLMALYLLDKQKIIFSLYGMAVTVVLYNLNDSRTGMITCFTFILLANLGVIFKKLIEKVNFKYGYILATAISILFVFMFHDNAEANELFSTRPSLLYDLLVNAKWHLVYGHMKYIYCDNRVVYLIIRNGLLSLLAVNAFYYLVFKKEKSVELKILFIVMVIYGMSENLRSLGQCIVPLIGMWSLYDNYAKENIKETDENIQKLPKNDNN